MGKPQSTSRKIFLTIIMLVVLIGPALFYLWIISGKNNYKVLPYFGPYQLNTAKQGDTIRFSLSSYNFFSIEDGDSISLSKFAYNKTLIANFVDVATAQAKDDMRAMQDIAYEYKKDSEIVFLTHFFNTTSIGVDSLNAFIRYYYPKKHQWKFALMPSADLQKISKEEYFNPVVYKHSDSIFTASPTLILIDKHWHLRGYMDATDLYEVKRAKEEIKVLKHEYKQELLSE